jgi:hypothetical protein
MAMHSVNDINSKGFTLLGALEFVDERYGKEARGAVIDVMDSESREILSQSILTSGWYPFRVQVALYEAIDRVLGTGDLSLCSEIGKFTCEHEMTTIHKMFLRMASLELWVKSAGLMWGRYYSVGGLEIEEIGDDAGRVKVVGFNPLSKAFCADFGGWLHRTLELNNRENVTVEHPDCVLDGAPCCRYLGRWTRS